MGLLGTGLPLPFGAENQGSLGSISGRENGHRGADLNSLELFSWEGSAHSD